MVSTLKKQHQNKRQLIQLNKTLNDFIIGNDTNPDAIENETLEPLTNGIANSFGRFTVGEISASQDQLIAKNTADNISKEVDIVFMVVGK